MSQTPHVVTIGEIMLGLRAPQRAPLEHCPSLECLLTGAEANVAVGLARLGMHSSWIGKLPLTELARGLTSELHGIGVHTEAIVWSETGRLGIMYIELGCPPRPNRTIYDREHSAASTLNTGEVNWDYLRAASHLHFTGITPALSQSCKEVIQEAISVANQAGLTISCDVNYRSTLWTPDEAASTLVPLMNELDVLFLSDVEARLLLGIEGDLRESAQSIQSRTQARYVLLSGGTDGIAAADSDQTYSVTPYNAVELNRIGVGDAFNAGFLYGLLTGDLSKGLQYGAAVAALKVTISRVNYPLVTLEQVQQLILEQSGSGGVTDMKKREHTVIR